MFKKKNIFIPSLPSSLYWHDIFTWRFCDSALNCLSSFQQKLLLSLQKHSELSTLSQNIFRHSNFHLMLTDARLIFENPLDRCCIYIIENRAVGIFNNLKNYPEINFYSYRFNTNIFLHLHTGYDLLFFFVDCEGTGSGAYEII